MTPLELVPSYETCMEFTKRGIILVGCCLCWVRDNDDQQVKLIEASRMMDINDLKGEVTFLSHAPTLSELEQYAGSNVLSVDDVAKMIIAIAEGEARELNFGKKEVAG